jgi:hypothetical protein
LALAIEFQVDVREQRVVVKLFKKFENAFVIGAVMKEGMSLYCLYPGSHELSGKKSAPNAIKIRVSICTEISDVS